MDYYPIDKGVCVAWVMSGTDNVREYDSFYLRRPGKCDVYITVRANTAHVMHVRRGRVIREEVYVVRILPKWLKEIVPCLSDLWQHN